MPLVSSPTNRWATLLRIAPPTPSVSFDHLLPQLVHLAQRAVVLVGFPRLDSGDPAPLGAPAADQRAILMGLL